jgi:hypothetical protein
MKTKTAIAVIAFAGALQLALAQPTNQTMSANTTAAKNQKPPATATFEKHKFQIITPFSKLTLKKPERIEHYGNMSSRPWSQIAGWHPGESQFPTAENQEPKLVLIQFRW